MTKALSAKEGGEGEEGISLLIPNQVNASLMRLTKRH
jgi:hypothetical protein